MNLESSCLSQLKKKRPSVKRRRWQASLHRFINGGTLLVLVGHALYPKHPNGHHGSCVHPLLYPSPVAPISLTTPLGLRQSRCNNLQGKDRGGGVG